MKKKTVFGMVLFALFVLQAQMVFAADYNADFRNELNRNNIRNIERLLERRAGQMNLTYCLYVTLNSEGFDSTKGFNKANRLDVVRLLVRYGADVNKQYAFFSGSDYFEVGYPLESAVEGKHSIAVIQFLLDSGANPNMASSYFNGGRRPAPVRLAYMNRNMPVVSLLLDRGANGADILRAAGSAGDNEMIRLLISRGVQIRSEQGAEALRFAAVAGHFDTIKLLVENGVNINARSNDNDRYVQEFIPLGATAASIAYDKGEMEIYDYLKANGARDFEPRQVAAQPAAPSSTTNVYVQPSAPAQSTSTPSEPTRNLGREVADSISRAFEAPLENGRYRVSGGTMELSFAGIARAGNVSYKDAAGNTHRGTYSIDDNRLTINVMGRSYFYTITGKTSFSGNGESWFRAGF